MIKSQKNSVKSFFETSKETIIITTERRDLLIEIADKIIDEYNERNKINLNFICTHNSRRSQMAQVWAFYAAIYFEIPNVFSYSGGTEVTAFHRNTVRCLQGCGFEFNVLDFSHQNPRYLITFGKTTKNIVGFSKLYDSQENQFPYIAITTCNSADENCPFIPDAIHRFHLPYKDPKIFDTTNLIKEKYKETSKQIAGELFMIFSYIKQRLDC